MKIEADDHPNIVGSCVHYTRYFVNLKAHTALTQFCNIKLNLVLSLGAGADGILTSK